MSSVFGPVPSRRLGRSLGIDLVPFKTCTYDCIYCQLGRTTHKTIEPGEWVDPDVVVAELEERLSCRPDYITLSGSGEPTLYSRIAELIDRIQAVTDVPVAVLTNGSLLWQRKVRAAIRKADLVIPSLDAGDERMFQAVNRPHESISFERMIEGLIAFREEYPHRLWLEVFLLAGHTGVEGEVRRIAECARRIRPDRIQLNTATRPTAEAYATRVENPRMASLAQRFDPTAEVIADYRGVHEQGEFVAGREQILSLLQRRPCTRSDISLALGLHINEVVKYLEELATERLIETQVTNDTVFYHGLPGRA